MYEIKLLQKMWITREIKYLRFCTHSHKPHMKQTSRKQEWRQRTLNYQCENTLCFEFCVVICFLCEGGRNSQRISANIWRELYWCSKSAKMEKDFENNDPVLLKDEQCNGWLLIYNERWQKWWAKIDYSF